MSIVFIVKFFWDKKVKIELFYLVELGIKSKLSLIFEIVE